MARPLRLEFPDAVYHVTTRGNGRQNIFADDADRQKFIELLEKTVDHYNWQCHAYCLMENHYHLMIETPESNISKGMHHLNGNYSQAHHKRHGSVGHLFQGRFKSIVVDKEHYLLELSRYVVLNPVRAGFTKSPEFWPWSSYAATAGLRKAPPCLTTDWLLQLFGANVENARLRYRAFVHEGIEMESPWRHLKSQLFLGSKAFMESLDKSLSSKETIKEVPKKQRYAHRPTLEEIFGSLKSKRKRNEAVLTSYTTYRYSQKEIADHLQIHYTTVSRLIKRLSEKR